MKKQKKILWRKGIHLAFSEKWNTGFGGFKKFCFHQHLCILKAKLGRPITWSRQVKHFQCRKKALQIQKTWIQDAPFFAKTKSSVAAQNVSTLSSKVKRKDSKHFISSSRTLLRLQAERLLSSAKNSDHEYCGEKSVLKAVADLPASNVLGQANGHRPRTEPQASDFPMKFNGESQSPGFLDEVMKKYGSLVPLSEKDVLGRLKDVFNEDFSNRKPFINREITNYRARHQKCNFRIFYNKHMLDMDDLATLDGQNWLNDQVINMYGELIMDAVPDKVHFFNSFFHRQLVTKGYNGVKRWTKKVDLFKKSLLLIPIHLEVHWSLITVTLSNRIISFYDSQGIHFKFCVENIRKYLLTEAREKNRPEFLQGWQTAVTKCIPQQKNDSDCGVFVLQYCKCLALEQPFQFSQEDMPRVRKRIYKELCECRLMD
ncbi:sentrin-specific protease 5 isoform X4 [Mirounga leonina]|uniref:sentrin-specific protease 5 isoform X4 n=1 Tax=Mirounga leonina TaxID=9715 RepID=UPI00156C113F|nr:sentrin-specific protease 5 isoform X4 [Mirounga leonina]